MMLLIPYDPAGPLDLAAMRDLAAAAAAVRPPTLYTGPITVRMRFFAPLPAGHQLGQGGGIMPDLPTSPPLPTLTSCWAAALQGVLWDDSGQIVRLHAQREWTRGEAGVEVTI
jgi:hypothetical protein